jgi:hypothetical protein
MLRLRKGGVQSLLLRQTIFIHSRKIKRLFWAMHCSGCWGTNVNKIKVPTGSYILDMEETTTKCVK